MTAFVNRPDDERMAFRQDISPLCSIEGYYGNGVQLRMPRLPELQALATEICAKHGLIETRAHYFPLGSDNAPRYMRHDGRYPGCRGFWLNVCFEPAEMVNPL